MRVTILALGSRGDVQPLLGFGAGLAASGHAVRFAAFPKFEQQASALGLEFMPLAEGQVSKGHSTAEGRRWLEHGSRHLPAWVALIQDARSVARQRFADAMAACEGAEAIVASELAVLLAWQASERFGAGLVRTRLSVPGRIAASPAAGVVRQAAWLAARPWLGSLRRTAGLPALPLREPIGRLAQRRTLELYAYSPAVMPAPPGAGPWTHVTGFWFLDGAFDPDPPAELVEFLAAGPAPVCVGFGSMLHADPTALAQLTVEALRRAGQRGVLIGEQYRQSRAKLPDSVRTVDTVDYGWLLERCAAAVHHGGAGTTAVTLRAGLPSVLVPHMLEQYGWARRVHELGASPPPIPRRKLSASALGDALMAAVEGANIRARAAALGEQIRAEDGIGRGVEAFAQHFARVAAPAAMTATNG